MINDDIKNEIKKHLGQYLEERGTSTRTLFNCLNPSHDDKNPSMSYDPKRNIIKCFSCNCVYDLIGLYALDNGLDEKADFKRIIEELANKYNIPLNSVNNNTSYDYNYYKKEENKEDFSKYITKCKKEIQKDKSIGLEYLEVFRAIPKELIDKYNIGYDKDKKLVIFPISNTCYLGRSVEKDPYIKHFKPKGVSNEIFNNKYIKESSFNSVIWVTEGILDALSLEAINEDVKAISLNSINNSKQLVEEIKKYNYKGAIVLALDTDIHGLRASEDLKEDLENLNIKTFVFNSSKERYDVTIKVNNILLLCTERLDEDDTKNKILNLIKVSSTIKKYEEVFKEANELYKEAYENKTLDETDLKVRLDSLLNKEITLKNKDLNEVLLATTYEASYNESDISVIKGINYFNKTIKDMLNKQANDLYEQENVFNYLDEFNKYILDEERTKALSTGIDVIDEALEGGFYKKNLVILGAISSMGKTTLALQIADNIARQKQDVLIFSLEMAKEELIAKSLSRLSFLNTFKKSSTYLALTTKEVMSGKGVKTEIPNNKDRVQVYSEVIEEYKDNIAKNVYISECNESLELNVKTIDEKIKRHISITGRKPFVIVDYLQIIKSEVKGTDTQIIASIVTDLKRIARNNDITIFLISAFNRNSYSQEADLSSFRDSSTIEYTSDVLLSLQPRVLDGQTGDQDGKSTNKKKVNQEQQKENRELTLKILKNRNGRITDVKGITFYAKYNYMSFKNASINKED